MAPERAGLVTLAVPCRTDEPALGRTLAAARASWNEARAERPLELLVCLNGHAPATAPALTALRRFAEEEGTALVTVDAEEGAPPVAGRATAVALLTRRAGKAIAWNLLRRAAHGETTIFLDADVAFPPETFGLLLAALADAPGAVLASAKTTCVPRPTAFERVMAAPYAVDFPNLSAQLYAARTAGLPPAMPEDLIEPERWLELVLGHARMVRVPAARVAVRLPGTLADFFRQRIRIEMGKVQLAVDYPGLDRRGAAQPRARSALRSLTAAELARLGAYLALRTAAHAVARQRYRRGRTAGAWIQAATTKQWDPT